MEVVNRIFWKYGNKLFINTELVLLFRLHGNSRPDGCCSHATHIWPNCRRGDGSTCDWGWEWTVSSTAHEAYQWYNFCKSYENITKFTKYMMKLGSIVTILFYWFGQAYAFCPVAPPTFWVLTSNDDTYLSFCKSIPPLSAVCLVTHQSCSNYDIPRNTT